MTQVCVYGMEQKVADQDRRWSEDQGKIVDIAQDLELGSLEEQDEEAAHIEAILKQLPADARAGMQERMQVLSLLMVQDKGVVRSYREKKRSKTALLAHALSEGLKVQIERNGLMAAAFSNSSKIARVGAFIAACTLITNIVNVWLSHTGKK